MWSSCIRIGNWWSSSIANQFTEAETQTERVSAYIGHIFNTHNTHIQSTHEIYSVHKWDVLSIHMIHIQSPSETCSVYKCDIFSLQGTHFQTTQKTYSVYTRYIFSVQSRHIQSMSQEYSIFPHIRSIHFAQNPYSGYEHEILSPLHYTSYNSIYTEGKFNRWTGNIFSLHTSGFPSIQNTYWIHRGDIFQSAQDTYYVHRMHIQCTQQAHSINDLGVFTMRIRCIHYIQNI